MNFTLIGFVTLSSLDCYIPLPVELYFFLISLCRKGLWHDPLIIQLLFGISKSLIDEIDQTSMIDYDYQQPARLISRFVSMVRNMNSCMNTTASLKNFFPWKSRSDLYASRMLG